MKKKELLASESFSANAKRHYFIDLKRADNNSKYIQLTRSEQQKDGSYKRYCFIVFQDHFEQFISAFASLFQSGAYQERGYQTVIDIADETKEEKGIKAMPEDARPREKLFSKGAGALRNEELLAILLGSGSPGESAIELGKRILMGMVAISSCLKKQGILLCADLKVWEWPRQVPYLPRLSLPAGFMLLPCRKSEPFILSKSQELMVMNQLILLVDSCWLCQYSPILVY